LYAAQAQAGEDDQQNIAERLRTLLSQEFVQLLLKRFGLRRMLFGRDLLGGLLEIAEDLCRGRVVFHVEGVQLLEDVAAFFQSRMIEDLTACHDLVGDAAKAEGDFHMGGARLAYARQHPLRCRMFNFASISKIS
jgi:hypothetical protein